MTAFPIFENSSQTILHLLVPKQTNFFASSNYSLNTFVGLLANLILIGPWLSAALISISEVPSTQGLMHELLYTPKCKLAATSYITREWGNSGNEYGQERV